MTERVPISLITGYLGSGKTTLLRNILKDTKRRLAILMNEFGEIAIDSKVIEGKNVRMAELAGGCVCCSLAGEFEAAVEEILKEVRPEMIVVETTGVAEPDALIINIQDSLPQVQLDGVITVADADAILRFPEMGYIGRIQLEVADIILINKVDLVDAPQFKQVEEKIRGLNDTATIFKASYCQMDTELLFGVGIEKNLHNVKYSHPDMECFSFSSDKIFNKERFKGLAYNLPREVYRAKGFLVFADGSYLFNYVAGRWDMEEFRADNTELVFIGKGINKSRDEVLDRLRGCESSMGYRFLEDIATADIAFEATGETLEDLFLQAALATTNVMIRNLGQIERRDERDIKVEASEIDLLLFNFLQEIIFYKDAEQLLFGRYDVKISEPSPPSGENEKDALWGLMARAYGERLDTTRHDAVVDVKAVTLHQFEVKKMERGWKAMVILDI